MPLEQIGNSLIFYAFYTLGGTGATGLTVTADVWRIERDGSATEVQTGQAATEIGDGLYRYLLASGSVTLEGEYLAVFKCAGTVDQAHIPAMWTVGRAGIENMHTLQEIVDGIWDEVLSTSSHNDAQSAGKRVRQMASAVVREETAQGSGTGTNQIQLDTSASAVDGAYDPAAVCLIGGTGEGQSRLILQYDGGSKTATVDRDWKVNPAADTVFQILCDPGREHVNEGLAQAGSTATSIKLNALASDQDDAYLHQLVFIRAGTGADQARRVTAYDGTTKVATVDDRTWDVTPDETSAYVMLPTGLSEVTNISIADAVLDEVVEGTLTLRQLVRIFTAVLAGISTGGGTLEPAFRDVADSKNRLEVTADITGNRLAVTLDGT